MTDLKKGVLAAAQITMEDVLLNRQKQLTLRLMLSLLMMASYGSLVDWTWVFPFTMIYVGIQTAEIICFAGPNPWFSPAAGVGRAAALAVLFASSALFGAPTLLLIWQLGSWGDVCAAYLLCGTILNSVLTTIGCRPAFIASALPFFVYLCILPFDTLNFPNPPPDIILGALIGGGVFLIFNVCHLWLRWSRTKTAEINAVRNYVAERDENEQRLYRASRHDPLTGLLNRTVLQARLGQNAREGAPGALLLIDLDGFKYVNDTLGHSAGDVVLREVAGRIGAAAGVFDTAARLGGDEFGLLLPGIDEAAAALAVAEELIAEVTQPVTLDGQLINIGASIGIAIHPLHGQDAEQLFSSADLALYQAKAEGRHCARVYHPELRAQAQGKVLRDTELRLALERGEFEIFYQPQVRLTDGALTGAEALIRWRHPERGLLTPGGFLSALEGGLLSARVGAWAIETACRQAARWRATGAPDFRIGVNLFGAQFRSGNLVAWVAEACAKAGLPPAALEIEITENVILKHEDDIIGPLQELRALGVGVAFDDYGTGFASLSMLTRYPVSRLKIDQRFTKSVCESAPDAAIIQAVLGLASALHLHVTAEGIETPAQAQALICSGCEEGQGYYYGAPMPAEEFTRRFVPLTVRSEAPVRAL